MKKIITKFIMEVAICCLPFIPLFVTEDANKYLFESPTSSVYKGWYELYLSALFFLLFACWLMVVQRIVNFLLSED